MSGEGAEGDEDAEEGEDEGEEEEGVQLPTVEVPEMMSDEVSPSGLAAEGGAGGRA